MKILVVPDIHMKTKQMLPKVAKIANEQEIDKIVFIGDYFDDWHQVNNAKLYRDTIDDLKDFYDEFDCVFLLGNHDVPYITNEYHPYSSPFYDVRLDVYAFLKYINAQVAYQADGVTYSHAGFCKYDDIKSWMFEPSIDHFGKLRQLDRQPGSALWIRPDYPGSRGPNQVVGHTPVNTVQEHDGVTYIDTWSTYPMGGHIGDGSVVIVDNGEITPTF